MANKIEIGIGVNGIGEASNGIRTITRSLENLNREAKTMLSPLDSLRGAIGALGFTYLIKDALRASLEMERLQKLFGAAAGNAGLAAREFAYVRELSERMGLDITTTADSYGKFMAAIRGTTIEGEKGRKVFSGVSTAITALSLSSEQSGRIFTQLQQMMSKGKVTAEDLNVVAESLPGVRQKMAEGLGITTQAMGEMMAKGKLLAADVLPALGDALQRTYGQAALEGAKSAQAEINRFTNAVKDLGSTFGSALTPAFTSVLTGLTPLVGKLKEFIGGFQILSVQAAALPDRLSAAWQVVKTGEGLFSAKGQAMYRQLTAPIDRSVNETINELMKKHLGSSSEYSAADRQRQAGNKPLPPESPAAKDRTDKLLSAQRAWEDASLAAEKAWGDERNRLSREITDNALRDLDREKEQGLITLKQYYDARYEIEKLGALRAMAEAQNSVDRAHESYDQARQLFAGTAPGSLAEAQAGKEMEARSAKLAAAEAQLSTARAASSKIDDTHTASYLSNKKQELEWVNLVSDATYEANMRAYDATAVGGLTNAIKKYGEDAADVGAQVQAAFASAAYEMESAITRFVTTGKMSFKGLVDSILSELARLTVAKPLTNALAGAIPTGALFGSAATDKTAQTSGLLGTGGAAASWVAPAIGGLLVGAALISSISESSAAARKEIRENRKLSAELLTSYQAKNLAASGKSNEARRLELELKIQQETDATYRTLDKSLRENGKMAAGMITGGEAWLRQNFPNSLTMGFAGVEKIQDATYADAKRVNAVWEEMKKAQENSRIALERELKLTDNKLTLQLLEVQGAKNTVMYLKTNNEVREAEIAALDNSTQAIQREIWAEQDRQQLLTDNVDRARTGFDIVAEIADLLGDSTLTAQVVAARRQEELAGLSGSDRALKQYLYALQDQKTALEAAAVAMQKMNSSSIGVVDTALAAATTLKEISSGPLANLSPQDAYRQARAAFDTADYAAVPEAAKALLSASRDYYASGPGYQRDFQDAAARLAEAAGMTPADKPVDAQIALLTDIKNALTDSAAIIPAALQDQNDALQLRTDGARTALAAAIGALESVLNTPLDLSDAAARASVQEKMSILKSALEGKDASGAYIINNELARKAVETVYGNLAGALGGTIDTATATGNIKTTYSNVQKVLELGPSSTTAITAINSEYGKVNAAVKAALTTDPDSLTQQLLTLKTPITDLSTVIGKFTAAIEKQSNAALTQFNINKMNEATAGGYAEKSRKISVGTATATAADIALLDVAGNNGPDGTIDVSDAVVWARIQKGISLYSDLLPAYAVGGITSGPSLAGESGPEAVVPLPDGRTIPVRVSGSADNRDTVRELQAAVRILQAGFTRLIDSSEQQAKRLSGIESTARLQRAS